MPQMAPLSWTTLFILFIVIYMMVSTKIYFSSYPTVMETKMHKTVNKKAINWKW